MVFYFSGHGVSIDGPGNFLVPVDAPPLDLDASDYSLVKNYQSVDLTLKALQARKPKLVVAILDACRSYPTRQMNAKFGSATTVGLNTHYQPDNGQLVMYAASHGRTALSWIDAKDNNPHSVYTRVLIEEMQRPALSISAMADRVQQRVWALTAHRTPQQGGPQAPEYVNKLYAPFSFVPMMQTPVNQETEIVRLREEFERVKREKAATPVPQTATEVPADTVATAASTVVTGLVATDRRASGTLLEDKDIEIKAASRIRENLGERVHVNVASYNRRVLLTGEVPSLQDKQLVQKIVASMSNVSVINELGVMDVSSLTQRSSDALVTVRSKAALVDAKNLYANAFKLITERGIVYLMGRVTRREA